MYIYVTARVAQSFPKRKKKIFLKSSIITESDTKRTWPTTATTKK